jgi:hypothetical protein
MKANELRVGNLFQDEEGIFPITVTYFNFLELNLKTTEPIILTEEWLLKFGFEKTTDGFLRIKTRKRGVFLEINLKTKRFILFNSFFIELLFLKNVHQLQNLYFALIGEELKIG